MTLAKFRTAILVFIVGFALGLSVFVASRMFVRAILSNDAIAAAEHLAAQLADEGGRVDRRRPLLHRPLQLLRSRRKSRNQRSRRAAQLPTIR